MKLRSLIISGLILIVINVATATGAAPAAADFDLDLPVIADDTAHALNTAAPFLNNEANLWVGGSKLQPGDPCSEQTETFLKFDLSTVPADEVITSATLTLKSNGLAATSTNLTMRLYGSTDTGWSEGAGKIAPWISRPAPSIDLGTEVTGLTAKGTNVVFNSTDPFVAYLQGQHQTDANKWATLVIVTTACNSPAAAQYFSSKETTGANAFTSILKVTSKPSAITLSTFRSADPAVNWPLIAGLAVFVVAGGVWVYRRRAATRA